MADISIWLFVKPNDQMAITTMILTTPEQVSAFPIILECDDSCKTWTGPGNAKWIECQKNDNVTYYSFNNTWRLECPEKYYKNENFQTWERCHERWTEWYGPLTTQCTVCDEENRFVLQYKDTWEYLKCPLKTYYNETLRKWKDCDSGWKEWFGELPNNCLSCSSQMFLLDDNSWKQWSVINQGLYYEPLSNSCLERWGKGFNLGALEWDDGNTINGDGWDQNWKIETDFKWTRVNETAIDTWVSLVGPHCTFTNIRSSTHLASIAWTENSTFGTIREQDISINIDGNLGPYKFEYFINETTGFVERETNDVFKVQFKFKSSLEGSGTCSL